MVTPFPFIERSISQALLRAMAEELLRAAARPEIEVKIDVKIGQDGPEIFGMPPLSRRAVEEAISEAKRRAQAERRAEIDAASSAFKREAIASIREAELPRRSRPRPWFVRLATWLGLRRRDASSAPGRTTRRTTAADSGRPGSGRP